MPRMKLVTGVVRFLATAIDLEFLINHAEHEPQAKGRQKQPNEPNSPKDIVHWRFSPLLTMLMVR